MFCDMTLPKGTPETGQQNAARVQQRVGWRSEPPFVSCTNSRRSPTSRFHFGNDCGQIRPRVTDARPKKLYSRFVVDLR
jgi:hypothetical protein